MKKLISILALLLCTSTAYSATLMGEYKAVSELCSDGTVYQVDADSNVMTSQRKDVSLKMNFLADNKIEVSSYFKDQPAMSGKYTVEYQISADNELEYIQVLDVDFAKDSPMNRAMIEQMLFNGPKTKVSFNKSQLIMSYPGFDGHGRCSSPAFIINILEKQ